MSDEAFARRFYSDRAELTALGVPLHSQRDEFTGEELYTLRSENYFLDRLDLKDDELAALQTALFYLDGKFAYAEPLRLALQNLALGRPGLPRGAAPTRPSASASARPTTRRSSPAVSRSSSRRSRSSGRSSSPTGRRSGTRSTERTLNPYALRLDEGIWYVVGQDLDRDAVRTFRVSRIRSDIRFATRRERDFRLPPEFDVEAHRVPRPWQIGETVGQGADRRPGRHRLVGAPHARRRRRSRGRRLRDRLRQHRAARRLGAATERPRRPARARRRCATPSPTVSPGSAKGTTASSPALARERRVDVADRPRRPSGRADRTRALRRPPGTSRPRPLRLRRGPRRAARRRRSRAAVLDPARGAPGDLSLLNLVNFGGGCYTVYAEVDEDEGIVRVDKELYGDVFRRPPKLTPLEARAIRLAIDYVGPTIAAEAHTPLDRVRKKLEETFGQFDLPARPVRRRRRTSRRSSSARSPTRSRSGASSRSSTSRRATRTRRRARSSRTRSSASCPSGASTRGIGRPTARARTGSTGCDRRRLTSESFEPRDGFDPRYLHEPRLARLWHSPVVARWKLERGARALTDKAAISELPFKTDEWLLSEVLADARRDDRARARRHAGERRRRARRSCRSSSASRPRRKRPAARA